MAIITLLKPLDKPVTMPERKEFDMQSTPVVKWLGVAVVVAVVMLYIIFW
jgi:SSS family solute:Na+ symporter